MAKQKGKQEAAPAKASSGKTINRKRRSALERKCLPKAYKVLFARSSGEVMRAVHAAWSESRKKSRAAD